MQLSRDDDLIDVACNVVCRREGYRMLEVPIFSNRRHGGRSTTGYFSASETLLGSRGILAVDTRRRLVSERNALWARRDAEWRDTAQVASHWEEAGAVEPSLLRFRVRGEFWETLDRAEGHAPGDARIRASRGCVDGRRRRALFATYMRIPHPSGLVYDRDRRVVHLASTRNPNQILELRPVTGLLRRADVERGNYTRSAAGAGERSLLPWQYVLARFEPRRRASSTPTLSVRTPSFALGTAGGSSACSGPAASKGVADPASTRTTSS